MVSAGSQPANSLAPQGASRVPFTNFTLSNTSNAAVTINGISVTRVGLASDSVFAGVVLLDQNGLQIGTPRTFDTNHQATIASMAEAVARHAHWMALQNDDTRAAGSAVQIQDEAQALTHRN